MISELISYTMSKPQAYLSGLMLFSSLLPLPLPLQASDVTMATQYYELFVIDIYF